MPDDEMPKEIAPIDPPVGSFSRKPYTAPKLTELGSIGDLTRGGDQEQKGEGPGFSL